LCEITLSGGKKQTPTEILNLADDGSDPRALAEIQTRGRLSRCPTITPCWLHHRRRARWTYGPRAQVRWFKGDNTGAAADAALVPQDSSHMQRENPAAPPRGKLFVRTVGGTLEPAAVISSCMTQSTGGLAWLIL
jgi:hypothetical protein